VLTGSFVNAGAIIEYIKKSKNEIISLVSTSPNITETNNEDLMLAYYIRDVLEGKNIDESAVKNILSKTSAYSLLFGEIGVPKTDFDLCLDFNRFNFVIKQITENSKKILVRENI
jgi:2-phosphosulfolactate phosphatase